MSLTQDSSEEPLIDEEDDAACDYVLQFEVFAD